MYLKSIEVHGFKSFANKILFEFHNGITGIVGPNGSGKSNVADAVRWVLGEQRMKQLRGASMQDVIFSGTENRKPLSYAYVAITLDNSDRQLNLDYHEVTVARRVYRSGESEYLINGTVCRLKDVSELFYDTGIGKEGYSIIGQGQIDKILSGKPEERRELFDEAAGIVKYKRRKATACKKLENERQNLVRVNDILDELEKQTEPLMQQSEKAKIYLKNKEELKTYDVNLFLMETAHIQKEKEEIDEKIRIAETDYKQSNYSFDSIKNKSVRMEEELERMDEKIEQCRERVSTANLTEGKLTGQINVLKEQIHSAQQRKEQFIQRVVETEKEKEEKQQSKTEYESEQKENKEQLLAVQRKKGEETDKLTKIQGEIASLTETIEQGKSEIIMLLNQKASTKANQQRYDTMLEQANIRKAQLNQMLIRHKSEEEIFLESVKSAKEQYDLAQEELKKLKEEETNQEDKRREWNQKQEELSSSLDRDTISYHKEKSRYDSLRNIAERYDGYGNSIRRVMEQKEKEPKIFGVVADLIKVEKQFETAIETALGGSIQNIVTGDEETAKRMIEYLKHNRFGRATFLPLTSMRKNTYSINEKALQEQGVIGTANTLVKAEEQYKDLLSYLLGRTYVVKTIDDAIALARKYKYSLRIVTLDGESLSPGGSMTGGAFKNSSNLLGRKREIEDLKANVTLLQTTMEEKRTRLDEISTALALLEDDLEGIRADLSRAMVVQNTAELHEERVKEQKEEKEKEFLRLKQESSEIDAQIFEINENKNKITAEIDKSKDREDEIEADNITLQKELEEKNGLLSGVQNIISEISLEEANYLSKVQFIEENIIRIGRESAKLDQEIKTLIVQQKELEEDIVIKTEEIDKIKETLAQSKTEFENLERELKEQQNVREQMSTDSKQFLKKREELSEHINTLDKELFRLNNQKEKLTGILEDQSNYMWEEYELTYHNAMEQREDSYDDLALLKKNISAVKENIRSLGDVNVNSIEDYKSLMERYTFLKTQRDDLVMAEKTLLELIDELDNGMRLQFAEKFAEIKKEFDKAFKELFGGGKGTLELVEEEDILESGVRIIAQPPGKKLQNMMQLSGGEKALTAIALLFAIQNLKPSPFCLLDEIEAALDDSNVGRFASYLHKLTKNTQFIIITHRRGTMAAADRLYGITMQEKGVSTLVSVNLIEDDLEK